jgi:hypothetical protein
MEQKPPGDYQPRRIFTLKEANGALPLVKRISMDIAEGNRKISDCHARMHRLEETGRHEDADDLREQIRELIEKGDSYVEELEKIGCEYTDRANGVVDFPALLKSRLVFLCWKIGDPDIRYWRDIEAGYSARRPIAGHFVSGGS